MAKDLQLVQGNYTDHHDDGLVDLDEAEDALSFCDLAINGNIDDYSKGEERLSCFNDLGQDLFEFSSFSTVSSSDSVTFCGKLISYKDDPILLARQNSYKKSNRFIKSISISQPHQVKKYNKTWSMPCNSSDGSNNGKLQFHYVKKVSIIATQVKSSSKWPFGVGRSPVEMEYKDINKRSMVRSNDEKRNESKKRSRKGLWGLLNVLMFKKRHTRFQG
ncbi:hypothetical protein ACFE04_011664 [Oxalis oulophora]